MVVSYRVFDWFSDVGWTSGVLGREPECVQAASVFLVMNAGDADARVLPVVGFSLVLVHRLGNRVL